MPLQGAQRAQGTGATRCCGGVGTLVTARHRSKHREEDFAIKPTRIREPLVRLTDVVAFSAVPHHEHIAQLLGVICVQGSFGLFYPLYEANLA